MWIRSTVTDGVQNMAIVHFVHVVDDYILDVCVCYRLERPHSTMQVRGDLLRQYIYCWTMELILTRYCTIEFLHAHLTFRHSEKPSTLVPIILLISLCSCAQHLVSLVPKLSLVFSLHRARKYYTWKIKGEREPSTEPHPDMATDTVLVLPCRLWYPC